MVPSSPILLVEVIATMKVTCMERLDREHEVRGSKGDFVNAVRTRLRSHWGEKDWIG